MIRPQPRSTLFPYTPLFRSGTYDVRELSQPGWVRTLPIPPTDSYAVTITSGGAGVTGRDFGVFAPPPTVASVAIDINTDRKSTRLNSSHSQISYAVFCLKKK